MPTLVLDPPPAELQALLERRRRWGADTHDEVWDGVLHMAPAPLRRHARLQAQLAVLLEPLARAAGLEAVAQFNLGDANDFRVPDGALLAPGPDELYVPTASLVVEILSPGDETMAKLPFYAAHNVDEVLIVDPEGRSVQWLGLTKGQAGGEGRQASYEPIERSSLIALGPAELEGRLDWP